MKTEFESATVVEPSVFESLILYYILYSSFIICYDTATLYEMRIASDPNVLRSDFMNGDILDGNVTSIKPTVSGAVERLVMVVSSNDNYTSTTYFAIVAIDDVGNRGQVSNIVPITIGQSSQLKGK